MSIIQSILTNMSVDDKAKLGKTGVKVNSDGDHLLTIKEAYEITSENGAHPRFVLKMEDAEGKTIFNDCKEGEQYREYEKMVDNAVSYAYVLTKQHKFGYIEIMEDYLKENQLKYKKGILGCHVIYYDFSKDVRPEDIDFAEEWRQRNL